MTGVGHLVGAAGDLDAGGLDAPHDIVEVVPHLLHGTAQGILVVVRADFKINIAIGKLAQRRDNLLLHVFGKFIHGPGHLPDLVLAVKMQTVGKVATAKFLQHVHRFIQRGGNAARDQGDQHQNAGNSSCHNGDCCPHDFSESSLNVVEIEACSDNPAPFGYQFDE